MFLQIIFKPSSPPQYLSTLFADTPQIILTSTPLIYNQTLIIHFLNIHLLHQSHPKKSYTQSLANVNLLQDPTKLPIDTSKKLLFSSYNFSLIYIPLFCAQDTSHYIGNLHKHSCSINHRNLPMLSPRTDPFN